MFKFLHIYMFVKFFKIQIVIYSFFSRVVTFYSRACRMIMIIVCKITRWIFNFVNFYLMNTFITLASAALELKDENCDKHEEEIIVKGKLFFWSPCKYWNARLSELIDYIVTWSKLSSFNTLITVFIIFLTLLIFKLTIVGIHHMMQELKMVMLLAPEDRPDYIYYVRLKKNGISEYLSICILLYFIIELKMFIKTL